MILSVVIPTRNRAELLGRCLLSLQRQTLPADQFEVIVVDNGSNDHTAEIVRGRSEGLRLVYRYNATPGLHIGRHEGLRVAASPVLVYGDDDITAVPTWLEAIASRFVDPSVALVGGNNYPDFETAPPAWLERLWERGAYKGRAISELSVLDFGEGVFEIDPRYVWGCNFAIRREVLLAAKGFHPDGMPIERLRYRGDGETHVADFVRRSAMKTVFDSRASVNHWVPRSRMTREYFLQRHYAQGISDSFFQVRTFGPARLTGAGIRTGLRQAALRLKISARYVMGMNDPVERELARLRMDAARAYWSGFRYHAREVSNDKELLSWVMKESYLE